MSAVLEITEENAERGSCIFAHGLRVPGPHHPHKHFQWEEMAFFSGYPVIGCWRGMARQLLAQWHLLVLGPGVLLVSHLIVSSRLYHILSFLPPSFQSRKRKKYFSNGVWQLCFEYWKESGLFWQDLFIHFNECCMSEVESYFFEKFKLALFIVSLINEELACACRSSLRACRGRGDCPDAAVSSFAKEREKKTTHHVLDPAWRIDWQGSLDIKSTELEQACIWFFFFLNALNLFVDLLI